MSTDDHSTDAEFRDVVREETALDLAAFRRFVHRVGDGGDGGDVMEAAMAAADRIEALDGRMRFLEQELGRRDVLDDRGEGA